MDGGEFTLVKNQGEERKAKREEGRKRSKGAREGSPSSKFPITRLS